MLAAIWFLGALIVPEATVRGEGEFPEVTPESVGFSSERLGRLDAVLQRMVDEREFAGIVTLAARHGKIFQSKAYGLRDIASGTSMEKDTIFRIYSMTKPITGVAMMILYEEGRWSPLDPISKYIPEFSALKVFKGFGPDGKMILEEPTHPPTMRELMTHTAGFSYGPWNEEVDKLYRDNAVQAAPSLQDMIERLAKIPLFYQPGTRWVYSVSVDIQGYLVQKLSGKTLPDFLRERIFAPLRMKDTEFYVPDGKWSRFATSYKRSEKGELIVAPEVALGNEVGYEKEPTLPSGGGGLVSTAGDYLRFAQMLLNGGELGGVRILGPKTVKLMTSNHLPEKLMTTMLTTGEAGAYTPQAMRPGFGFGFDFGVYTDPALADHPCGKGTYLWSGLAGTWFWIDPTDDVVFVGMVQRLPGPGLPFLKELAQQATYQALIALEK